MKLSSIVALLLGLITLAPALSLAQDDEIDMDDVKISLVKKGELTAKKINGPNKELLQLKISQQLLSSQESTDSLITDNLNILETNIDINDSATLPVLDPNQVPVPGEFATTPIQLDGPIDFPTDINAQPLPGGFPLDPDEGL